MVLKSVLLLLVLSVSQAFAASLLQLRSLESRQTATCPVCDALLQTIQACTTLDCVCNKTVFSDAQTCINCFVTADPTKDNICIAQSIIDASKQLCSGVPGLPTLTLPTGIATPTGCPTSTIPLPSM